MIDPAVIRSIHESRLALLQGPPFHGRDIHELMNTTTTRVRKYFFCKVLKDYVKFIS